MQEQPRSPPPPNPTSTAMWQVKFKYRKSSIKSPPGGDLFISSPFERGLIETGGLFNYLETKMVSVLHKELECKVEKLKYKNLEACSRG